VEKSLRKNRPFFGSFLWASKEMNKKETAYIQGQVSLAKNGIGLFDANIPSVVGNNGGGLNFYLPHINSLMYLHFHGSFPG